MKGIIKQYNDNNGMGVIIDTDGLIYPFTRHSIIHNSMMLDNTKLLSELIVGLTVSFIALDKGKRAGNIAIAAQEKNKVIEEKDEHYLKLIARKRIAQGILVLSSFSFLFAIVVLSFILLRNNG